MHAPVANPAATLTDEQVTARHLVEVLNREQACLINADIDALVMVTEEKTTAIAQMSALALARHRSLAVCGHEASELGMLAWVEGAGSTSRGLWNAMLESARTAKELNRTNGLLIGTHMVRTQSTLNVLHGSAQGGSFYGPDGQATSRGLGRGVVVG
ncbi:MAG: flagellar protein FlgN [Herminiimonas sp.]|nr:flagellar protein FlgN [Herminiimonas sp.]